jgi:alpha-tubulin suppressor-like RCC1 family protein
MGSTCSTVAPQGARRVAGGAAAPDEECTCFRYDPVPCLDHRLVALGLGHICALVGDQVQCWGDNAIGALGNDVPNRSLVPIPVDGLAGLIPVIAAGGAHTCAIVEGAIKCWGSNMVGELGDGKSPTAEPSSHSPVQVVDLPSRAQAIAAAIQHSCAIVDGVAWCWGSNGLGELGIPPGPPSSRPVKVNLASGVEAIATGSSHSCAILHGAVWCWGNNRNGQLGSATPSSTLEQPIAAGAQAISLGGLHSCAIVNGGALCWGDNQHGQLGDGSVTERDQPTAVPGLEAGVLAVAAGSFHTCALMTGGTVKCWGENSLGQVGNGLASSTLVTSPSDVTQLPAAQALFSSGQHTCAIADGAIRCWGSNFSGELGTDPDLGLLSSVPLRIPRLGCAGAPDLRCRVAEGCADDSVDQVFDGNLVGCAGAVAFADRASLCGPGYQPATATQWVAHRRSVSPTHDYWTDDPLRYNGTGPSACFVSTVLGVACDPATPMRVCTSTGMDPEGNHCDWTNCGLDVVTPDQFFGGCRGDLSAGTLCMPIPPPPSPPVARGR